MTSATSAPSTLRVAVWSTGGVGSIAVQAIARRPGLDLTGVWVHSPEKAGKDAGLLTGGEVIGVAATNDAEAILRDRPDCVCYAASDGGLNESALDDYVRMLRAGINVVTVSTPGLVYPPAFSGSERSRLEEAAQAGSATLYASGLEPGFAGDQLTLTLLTLSRGVRSVRAQEIFLYDGYPVAFMMFDVFGFGQPLEHQPIMAMPGVQSGTWGPVVSFVAAALGVELDEIRETYQRELTPRRLEVASGTIEAATVGAIRMETIGVVDGRDAIVVEHINRMAADLAQHWPTAERDGTYRIVVDGDPSMRCDLVVGASDESATAEGMVATTMRIVNAIPAVCAAPTISSEIAKIEVIRAARRIDVQALPAARSLIRQLDLVPLRGLLIDDATDVGTSMLRALDAVHLASALAVVPDLTAFVAYDRRLCEAAESLGIRATSPAA